MPEFTFVHAADLHLDAPFRGVSGMLLSGPSVGARPRAFEQLARLLREGTFIALRRLTDLCIREKADFLLLAGDVYNSADSSLRARLALRDAFARLEERGVQVFLAHGNHDPLSADAASIPWPGNVTVFGSRIETHAVARAGETLALIHGISHTSPRENKNLARLFKRARSGSGGPDVFQAGVLHCALSDMSGAHAPYAQCSFGDLSEGEMDYWALGHVHACRVLDSRGKVLPGYFAGAEGGTEAASSRPFAAYSGSLQGLHVNESGPHGCLLLKTDGRGGLAAEAVPLAPVQWEHIRLELSQDIGDIPSLENFLLENLTSFAPRQGDKPENLVGADGFRGGESPETGRLEGGKRGETGKAWGYPPEAVLARLSLAGRSGLDHELRKNGAVDDLIEHLNEELDGSGLWVRDMDIETRPLADPAAIMERPDLVGETLRRAFSLRQDPEALAAAAEQSLAPLFQRPKIRKLLAAPADEELARLADEAALLCLDLLEGE